MRIKTDKQAAVLNVQEVLDRLGEIGANEMGHFTALEAAFYHAACNMLIAWIDSVEESAFDDDDYERAAEDASRIADAREGFSDE